GRQTPRLLDVSQTSFSNSSGVKFNITYSDDESSSVERGFNLVGNPYGATIDWDDNNQWTKTNIDNTIYIWDQTANGGYGDYKTWNGFAGSLGDGLIAPFQAFWVKADDDNPVLKVEDQAQTTGGKFLADKRGGWAGENASIELKLESGSLQTKSYITFSKDADRRKDSYDAYRLVPFTDTFLKLYTTFGSGSQLVINNLPLKFGKPIEIPLYVGGFKDAYSITGSFTLSWPSLKNVPKEWKITLVDKVKGKEISIDRQKSYTFTRTSAAQYKANGGVQKAYQLMQTESDEKARFMIRIDPEAAAKKLHDK